MATSDRRYEATIAALEWVGAYEAADPESDFESITLGEAFERYRTAAVVKRHADEFPEDLVDAFAMLRRMVAAQARARGE